jgi:hypothetical protein
MRKVIVVVSALVLGYCNFAFAGDCQIPKFIKKGAVINADGDKFQIIEIDEQSCWIKGSNKVWYNLGTLLTVQILE